MEYQHAQAIMTRAYEKYQTNPDWSYDDFINHLDYPEKVVVVTGNLNYQVENGGFSQWHFNGYWTANSTLVYFLENELATDTSRAVAKLVREVVALYAQADRRGDQSTSWRYYDEDEDDDPDTDEHSRRYYELNETLMSELEAYVKQRVTA